MEEARSQYEFSVLVVDDNEETLEMLELFFERNNIKAYMAKNAERALHMTAEHPSIKVLLTDLHMPESCVGGKTLAIILMEREPRTIAFAMTGYPGKFSLDDCRRVGFMDYFVKPLDFKLLLSSIRFACGQVKRWEMVKGDEKYDLDANNTSCTG